MTGDELEVWRFDPIVGGWRVAADGTLVLMGEEPADDC